jgi:hypothetical protein
MSAEDLDLTPLAEDRRTDALMKWLSTAFRMRETVAAWAVNPTPENRAAYIEARSKHETADATLGVLEGRKT